MYHHDSAILEAQGATVFFNRELEKIMAETYDVKYPELSFASGRLIPIDTSAGPGAETVTYRQFDMTGIAKFISSYADDLPLAGIAGKEFVAKLKSIGSAYAWSLQDIRAAQMAGRGLTDQLARAARRSIEQLVNRVALRGDEETGLLGLLTNDNIPRFDVENDGDASGTTFASKLDSPDLIVRDMNAMVTSVVTTTNGVERPDTLLMPLEQYQLIATTPRADNSDTTILEFFQKANPGVMVEGVHELAGAGTDGVDIMIAYRNSPECLKLERPVPFEQLPVQETNLTFKVPCHGRVGGVIVHYPLSIAIGEGI